MAHLTTTQVAVLGSAAIAAMMSARLTAELGPGASGQAGTGGVMPPQVVPGFSAAMGQSMFLPAGLLLIAVVAVVLMEAPGAKHPATD